MKFDLTPRSVLTLVVPLTVLVIGGKVFSADRIIAPPLDLPSTIPALQLGKAFAGISAHVRPSVVSIFSERVVKTGGLQFSLPFQDDFLKRFFGNIPHEFDVPLRGTGSGMIVDQKGHVLTNHHVIHNMTKLKVQLEDESTYGAQVIQSNPIRRRTSP